MSTIQLITKTIPFLLMRLLIYGVFAVVALVFLGIMIGIGFLLHKVFGDSSMAFIVLMVITFGVIRGGLRFLEQYVLYIVKVGHISVVVELIKTGKIPEGKGQIAYGKEQVKQNFGTANVAFVVDKAVHGAVRQIQRWVLRVGDSFSFVPGIKNIIGIVNAIMSVSLNYIDEAVVSYIILRKNEKREENVWKSACDGVVLYAQSWKGILKTATGAVIFIFAFGIVTFLIFALPLMGLSKLLTLNNPDMGMFFGFIALIGAYILTLTMKRALIDPLVTIAMVNTYQKSIYNETPSVDLHNKLLGVSSKFKTLANKSKEPEPARKAEVVESAI
ncbi:hypothetical protein QWT69_10155 [Sporosarcina oncorhynchi]|uniref:Uncharacterized protein n=1 Tax=Sporosarcina oncorhynchi TaxID=3056444 RepID=A0ABZ0L115_9BACL|nr:hypothetical protein [Sporosarcina sp. T2O-4]WOV86302.1 hypothetical protein QWT69_10155 [Sporosarcina sp. T2O-4]